MTGRAGDPVPRSEKLRVTEIFLSIQGESRPAGLPTVFVRLTGCPLRCSYCDTSYAFHGGELIPIDDILQRVAGFDTPLVCVTGGEPLAQPSCLRLLKRLCDRGLEVSLETSGALALAGVDERVCIVMDLKTPSSGELGRNRWSNLELLKSGDQLKFVIGDRGDYEWARRCVSERDLSARCAVLFSPSWGKLAPRQLAEWILEDRLRVRLQVQLHKYLWGDEPGR